jgi:hypothetical protein
LRDLADKSSALYKPAIISLDGVKAIGAEPRRATRVLSALKTNIFIYDDGAASRAISQPGGT